MASSITSAGAASGMDFESIISASLEAKRAQLESQTTTKKEEANVELSGVGQLKSALESFQSTLQAFTEDNAFNTRKITIDQPSDTTYFTVSAEDDVSNMYHDIIVEQLSSSLENPAAQVVFCTASRDTRYEGYGILRPLIESDSES